MSIRDGDQDREFRKKLQNPPKPINKNVSSPEYEQYLKDMNEGNLKSEETKRKEAEIKKNLEEKKTSLFCPTCKKTTLKKSHVGYACGHCGLSTLSPLRMHVDQAVVDQNEKEV